MKAAQTYNNAATKLFGKLAYLNLFEPDEIHNSDTRQIPLTKGKFAIIDACDYEYLMQWNWQFSKYAMRGRGGSSVLMHRVILSRKLGHSNFNATDHENRNKLDNRRSNLRPATHRQNQHNLGPCGGSSRFKGVHWAPSNKKWRASITFDGKRKYLGYFTDEIEAAEAYNKAASELFGEFAYINTFEEVTCETG